MNMGRRDVYTERPEIPLKTQQVFLFNVHCVIALEVQPDRIVY
jgi:hypothetical protein